VTTWALAILVTSNVIVPATAVLDAVAVTADDEELTRIAFHGAALVNACAAVCTVSILALTDW
jgi:hypothetical protein